MHLTLGVFMNTKTTSNKRAWVVTIAASLYFFYQFIQMNFFNSVNAELREAYHLDAMQLGQLFSMYFYANFLFLLPAGSILDRFSARRILLIAIATTTLGTFLFSMATLYWVAAVGRFMVGAAAAFSFLGCVRIASRWFAPKKMAFVTAMIVTMAMLGGLVAQSPFVALVEYTGDWRVALYLNSALGVIILFVAMWLVEDRPAESKEEALNDQNQLNELGLWRCIKLATLNPQNWLGGLYTALTNLPVFILGGLWGILYLTKVHHITQQQASYATTIFFVGVILGSLAYGWVSDFLGRRVLPMIVGAVLSFIVMCMMMMIPDLSLEALVTLFFLTGFFTSSQVLSYPLIAEINPGYLTGTALSIDSLCIMASGFIVPGLFGWLMEYGRADAVVGRAMDYSAGDFHYAMLLMPASLVLAFVLTFFMRETFCKSIASTPSELSGCNV